MTHTRRSIIAAAGAVAALLVPAAAEAASPRIQVAGLGTATIGDAATYEGELHGRPYSGAFAGRVDSYDGTLPGVGVCEPAIATLTITDDRGRKLDIWASGKVCGEFLPLGVMQRFTGRYVVQSASQRGLVGTGGALDVRLLNGQSDVYAVSA